MLCRSESEGYGHVFETLIHHTVAVLSEDQSSPAEIVTSGPTTFASGIAAGNSSTAPAAIEDYDNRGHMEEVGRHRAWLASSRCSLPAKPSRPPAAPHCRRHGIMVGNRNGDRGDDGFWVRVPAFSLVVLSRFG